LRDHGIEGRPYQVAACDAVFREFATGVDSTLVVAATGTGKTVLSGLVCERWVKEQGTKVLFLAHRKELINQAARTLGDSGFGLDMAIEMADQNAAIVGADELVIGSVQTLQSNRLMSWNPREFGLIIIDECHHSLADSYTKILNWFEGYKLLGITATPSRGDRRNLGARFQTKAYEYGLRRAIDERWLSPIKIRECQTGVDLRKIKTTGGDYNQGELEEAITPHLQELVAAFVQECGSRTAVVFTPDVGSAMGFAEVCKAYGKSADYVAGSGGQFGMGEKQRAATLARFEARAIDVVVCCELLIEGWDVRHIGAVCICRPTKQWHRYAQMVGRGTRLVIDFDWQTDEDDKDLCTAISLFDDGSIDPEIMATARDVERANVERDMDPKDILEEAERIVHARRKWRITLGLAKAKQYQVMERDPIGVADILDIKLNRKYDIDKRGYNPASQGQLNYLKTLGIKSPEHLSKWGASKLIGKLKKRQESGLASAEQVQTLLGVGMFADRARSLSTAEASLAIAELVRPRMTQGELFQ
jgi:superfamily II DNA or RNA helicase